MIDAVGSSTGWPHLQVILKVESARDMLFALMVPSNSQHGALKHQSTWFSEARELVQDTLGLELITRAKTWAPLLLRNCGASCFLVSLLLISRKHCQTHSLTFPPGKDRGKAVGCRPLRSTSQRQPNTRNLCRASTSHRNELDLPAIVKRLMIWGSVIRSLSKNVVS